MKVNKPVQSNVKLYPHQIAVMKMIADSPSRVLCMLPVKTTITRLKEREEK